jgi:hypothetical protein
VPPALRDRSRQPCERHRPLTGQVKALAERGGVPPAEDQALGQIVDVDRV